MCHQSEIGAMESTLLQSANLPWKLAYKVGPQKKIDLSSTEICRKMFAAARRANALIHLGIVCRQQ